MNVIDTIRQQQAAERKAAADAYEKLVGDLAAGGNPPPAAARVLAAAGRTPDELDQDLRAEGVRRENVPVAAGLEKATAAEKAARQALAEAERDGDERIRAFVDKVRAELAPVAAAFREATAERERCRDAQRMLDDLAHTKQMTAHRRASAAGGN